MWRQRHLQRLVLGHAVRLRQRSYLPHTLFFGYANGHNLYFPTIEAASEGGYGADSQVSPVELGAGETMMNQALKNLYGLLGKFKPEPARAGPGHLAAPSVPAAEDAARAATP